MIHGKRIDKKALRLIAEHGWEVTREMPEHGRWVAERRVVNTEDHSVTRMFESAYSLERLAQVVERRERESLPLVTA